MIDIPATEVLVAVAYAFVGAQRSTPPWVEDALYQAAQDSTLPRDVARRAEIALRDLLSVEAA